MGNKFLLDMELFQPEDVPEHDPCGDEEDFMKLEEMYYTYAKKQVETLNGDIILNATHMIYWAAQYCRIVGAWIPFKPQDIAGEVMRNFPEAYGSVTAGETAEEFEKLVVWDIQCKGFVRKDKSRNGYYKFTKRGLRYLEKWAKRCEDLDLR